ncbi:MAG: hypothetical protein ABR528_04565 [Pseudonocardiaceae bacterium]
MRAYKFTADDAVSVFTRFPWPVPAGESRAHGLMKGTLLTSA